MYEYDASLTVRADIIETALGVIFDTIPDGSQMRIELVDRLKERLRDATFDRARRDELERAIKRLSERIDAGS